MASNVGVDTSRPGWVCCLQSARVIEIRVAMQLIERHQGRNRVILRHARGGKVRKIGLRVSVVGGPSCAIREKVCISDGATCTRLFIESGDFGRVVGEGQTGVSRTYFTTLTVSRDTIVDSIH